MNRRRSSRRYSTERGRTFTVFVEAAELEKMDTFRTDLAIDTLRTKSATFTEEGFEIALHLHPQWCNARYHEWSMGSRLHRIQFLHIAGMTESLKSWSSAIAYLRRSSQRSPASRRSRSAPEIGYSKGSLKDLILKPAKELKAIFDRAGSTLVVFVEAAELAKIDTLRTDRAIGAVKDQIREFHQEGFEIALHLHPQWCNAQYQNGKWILDYAEYSLCPLGSERITEIVESSIAYLRRVLGAPDFIPLSFRAGNWLFQPTTTAARVLRQAQFKIDSSVFKGGLQHKHKLDYRRTVKNGYCWTFGDDVATPDPAGPLLEIPNLYEDGAVLENGHPQANQSATQRHGGRSHLF